MADLDLRLLRYFVAAAEEMHFGRAAARLFVTQQTLSAQIAKLEADLDVTLFTRSSRKVEITAAGSALLHESRDLLRHAEATRARVMRLKNLTAVRVGVHVTAFTETTSRLLQRFSKAHPDITVHVETYGLDKPAAGLLDGSTDIAVVRPPVAAPDLDFRILTEESRVFVLPADDPFAGRAFLTLDDVIDRNWVAAPASTDGTQPEVWRNFWLPPPPTEAIVSTTATTLDTWREYIAAGHGISLCPASSERFYARPGIAFVTAKNVPPCQLSLAWPANNATPATQHLITRTHPGD